MYSRRAVLQASGVCAASVLGGCSGSDDEAPAARLGTVEVTNKTDTEKQLILSVERDGEPVFASNYAVPPGDDSDIVITEGWPTEPGKYRIELGVAGEKPRTITLDGAGCISLLADISGSTVAVWKGYTPDRC